MRADRLVATLLLMQNRGRVTAAEIAAELEVSVATARRDLEALSAAGIPVYPQPGRGGGWQLIGGARTDLSGLTAGEARALFLLAGPSAGAQPEAKAALRKLVRALPQTFRGEAEAAADAVVIDPSRWGATERELPAEVQTLQRAVVQRTKVRLDYRTRTGEQSRRVVDPLGLVDKDGIWYLMAGTDRGPRTFRVDRIGELIVTAESFERPSDFDLEQAWEQVVEEVERQRSTVAATVLISPRLLPILRDQQGRHCVVDGPVDAGHIQVRITAPTAWMVAQQLAGWGDSIEVLGPPDVRAELARIGAALVDRYAGAGL
ncbi:YafY family transcriptional regulator [Nocardia cyriacigeorgica]|uniref:helix-turn-helix transcriptional regulator n=1 Tax=Nocardia cyriacigeorgica TaxID=135487 RepID=UPI00189408D3|nr:YafY family protein [Nocardia cyriacigeorgica]MBF6083070.1 YafY family transcriptional regulator [Nocardia cyriacigeorgica]